MNTVADTQSKGVNGQPSETSKDEEDLSRDNLYKMLANKRRRYVIHYLQRHREDVDLGTLAERVAAWEHGMDTDQITSAQRKSAYTALQQQHLPKMDDAGLVLFDHRSGTVAPTDTLADVDVYTEIVPSGEFPWSEYYLGLSATTMALLVTVWTNVPPLTAFPDIVWGMLCVTVFLMSAVIHVVVSRNMKLGEATRPPETDD